MAHHRLEPSRETLHGVFDPSLKPVLTVHSGDTVSFQTLEVGWRTGRVLPDGSAPRFMPRIPELDDGPALTGPVAVEGAEPGMLLEIEIVKVVPDSWGWNSAPGIMCGELNKKLRVEERLGVYWEIDPDHGSATNQWGHRVVLDPFPGTLGLAPAKGPVDGWTPRDNTAGNLDLKLLTAGARLYLPVEAAGGLLSVGDGHALQGDGEVGGTAIECPLRDLTLRLSLHSRPAFLQPWVEKGNLLATFGLGITLDEAASTALSRMLDLLSHRYRWKREQALALASVAVDLRLTQCVNPRVGAHAVFSSDKLGL